MIYNGQLVLKEDGNTYGIFDKRKGEFIELSKELDALRNSKIQITMKDNKDNTIYSQKGHIHSVRRFSKVYDIYIVNDLNSVRSDNSEDLDTNRNLTQVLFDHTDEMISISIKELTAGSEVIK